MLDGGLLSCSQDPVTDCVYSQLNPILFITPYLCKINFIEFVPPLVDHYWICSVLDEN